MAKVILHIGTHKTATTTIQDMFWTNAALLAEHGVIYPRFNKITGHHGLVYDWGTLPEVYKLPQGSRGALAEIARDYAKGDHTVFLSSEEFSRGHATGAVDFAELREILKDFDQIEVVCVLRTQWEFMQSVYLELSKKWQPPRPPVLVENALSNGMIAGLWVDYNGLLSQLEKVFAPEEITFLDFNTCRAAPGGILEVMLKHIGCPIGVEALQQVNDGASNVSPMSIAAWVANLLAEPKVAPPWLVQRCTNVLHLEKGDDIKPCLFTQDEFARLKTHFDAANAKLRERRQAVQPDFQISPADASKITLFRNGLTQAYWIKMLRVFVAEKM
jgi:hypothetical protein